MDMLALANLEDYASLQPDAWGIPSLPSASITSRHNCLDETEGTDTAGLDLVVMPGVAFDRQFRRLGHGKGYYDYWLQRCQEKFGRVPLLGTCLYRCCEGGEIGLGKSEGGERWGDDVDDADSDAGVGQWLSP